MSIVILNYDTLHLVEACLQSIDQFKPNFDYEIILVNNGSKRDTAEQLRALSPDALILDLPSNVGYGRANNYGVMWAQGEYLLLLNSDTYYIDESLDILMAFALRHPDLDIIGCDVRNPDLTVQESTHKAYPNAIGRELLQRGKEENIFCKRFVSDHRSVLPKKHYLALYGCQMLVKRSVFEATGGIDPDFFLYFEETEWFYRRLLPDGYKVGVCPQAQVVHIGKASQDPAEAGYQYLLSQYLFYYKHHPVYFVAWVLVSFFNLVSAAVGPLVLPKYLSLNRDFISLRRQVLEQAIWDVPRFPSGFGKRSTPLMGPSVVWRDFSTEEIEVLYPLCSDCGRG